MHVLVVDDDPPVRDLALRIVARLGGVAIPAADGAEALGRLAEGLRCDLLLTDVVMPGMSGGELAHAARRLRPGLPVVFVTGHNADPAVAALRSTGDAVLLPKPYRRGALAAALRQALQAGKPPVAGS